MLSRLRLGMRYLPAVEAVLIGVFFVQALRLLIGLVYSHLASALLVSALGPQTIDPALPGVVDPSALQGELALLMFALLLPLLTLIFGRARWLLVMAVLVTALGRLWIIDGPLAPLAAASLTVGGALLYTALIIRQRARILPLMFIFAFGLDQVFRAAGNTLDPSWSAAFYTPQLILSAAAILLAVYNMFRSAGVDQTPQDRGLLPFWSAVGLGGLLFLQLSLLALPNAAAGRAGVDYTAFVPLVLAAALVPLIPWVRAQARAFITAFDGSVRGWLWMLVTILLLVLGLRVRGLIGGAALVAAQVVVSLLWWWLVRPQAEKERNLTGLWLVVAALVTALLAAGDVYTYEYAFARDIHTGIAALDEFVSPLLRGFRGMGLALVLLAAFLAALPMTQMRRRVPWAESRSAPWQSLLTAAAVAGISILAAYLARPPVVTPLRDVDIVRIGTYNIHAGFNEFFHFDLEAIASTLDISGAKVILLQEVEAGRLTSFGVDQALWLARRLQMDRRFYATNEGLHGLAVLSQIPIVYDDGRLLASIGLQTGVQRVQVQPDVSVVTLYNTWLGLLVESPDGIAELEQDQQQQLDQMLSIIAADHPDGNLGRMVVGGTFNNTPTSPLADRMRAAGFVDPFAGLPLELSATLWRTGIRARVDFLWVRPPLLALSAGVMDTHPSDHRMAVIELQLSRR